jgi:rhodanese-related sulfurtransferase
VGTKPFRQALILFLLAFLPAIGQAIYLREKVSWEAPIPPSELVTVDLARQWGDNAIWVDARPEEEFQRDHIPGAILLNEDQWDDLFRDFSQRWSPDKKVVVYCSTQSCNLAVEVARRLRRQTDPPMKDVFVLKGGWEEWLKKK